MWQSVEQREAVLRRLRAEFRPVKRAHADIPDWAFWAQHPSRPGWFVVEVPPMDATVEWFGPDAGVRWSVVTTKAMRSGRLSGCRA